MKLNNTKMNRKNIVSVSKLFIFGILITLISCKNSDKKTDKKEEVKTVYASDVIPFFDHWK